MTPEHRTRPNPDRRPAFHLPVDDHSTTAGQHELGPAGRGRYTISSRRVRRRRTDLAIRRRIDHHRYESASLGIARLLGIQPPPSEHLV